jgi:protein-S-isoprenylcysteine O-methyltransferase Ste14
MIKYVVLCALWFLYFFLHSVLASNKVKAFFERTLKKEFLFYRILYSLISILGLFVLLFFNASIPSVPLFSGAGLVRYLSLLLATFGVMVISRAFREYPFSSFIGLKKEDGSFKSTGILKYVRHPIYSGTILVVIGFFLFTPTLATMISMCCILLYLPIGIYLEERKLIKQFGVEYVTYKKEVPSIFPNVKKLLFEKTSQD